MTDWKTTELSPELKAYLESLVGEWVQVNAGAGLGTVEITKASADDQEMGAAILTRISDGVVFLSNGEEFLAHSAIIPTDFRIRYYLRGLIGGPVVLEPAGPMGSFVVRKLHSGEVNPKASVLVSVGEDDFTLDDGVTYPIHIVHSKSCRQEDFEHDS